MRKDLDDMNDSQLLHELVRRFVKYDKARDEYVGFLQMELTKAGVDYESMKRWDSLHMRQDEAFCRVREVCRIAMNDPELLWC